MKENLPRKLVAILYADVAGYSRLTGDDEEATHHILVEYLDFISTTVESQHGKVMHYAGDAVLAQFGAAVDALASAIAIQQELSNRNESLPEQRRVEFRIGVNLGDVIEDRGDIYGDGVNVAARLESLADPGSICISDAVRSAAGNKLKLDFEDIGEQTVKNISSPVRAHKILVANKNIPATNESPIPVLNLPDKPSLAVLPFMNMSGDPEQEYFADGIVEGLTASLSRIKTFFVVARMSAYIFKDKAVKYKDVRDTLGVRYFIEGSVQKAGNHVRITVQLIETASGSHVWAEKYDGSLSDIFELQDKIFEQVAGALHPNIRQAEIDRSRRKPPQDLGAYDFVMRSMPFVWSLDKEDNQKALKFLSKAIELDADYPLALSLSAWCYGQQAVYNWSTSREATKAEALRLAKNAASLSGDDPLVLTVLGTVYSIMNNHNYAKGFLERAASLDPNSTWTWSRLGWANAYGGNSKEAIEHFETALQLSPHDPMKFNCYFGIGSAYAGAREFEKAIEFFERGLNEHPKSTWIYRQLIPIYIETGRTENAQTGMQLLLQTYPELTTAKVRDALVFSTSEKDWICERLKRAGLPD